MFDRQQCELSKVAVQPEPIETHAWTDYFGNSALYFAVDVPHDELTVTAESIVKVTAPKLPAPAATPPWEEVRDATAKSLTDKAAQFTFESPLVRFIDEAYDYALPSFAPGRPLLEAVLDLTGRILREFKYDPTASCVNTPTEEILRKAARRLPGLRPSRNYLPAVAGPRRPLRQRLSPHRPAAGANETRRGRRLARVAFGLLSAAELLVRPRPDQQSDPANPPRDARLGPRLRRRLPHQRGLSGRRRPPHVRLRRRGPHAG